jgi:cardiolipin synthase
MVTCRSLLLRWSSHKPYNIWSYTRQLTVTTRSITTTISNLHMATRYVTVLAARQPLTHQYYPVSNGTRTLFLFNMRAFSRSTPLKLTQNEANSNSPPLKRHKFQFKQDVLTLPNLLTMTRIATTPYLGHLILSEQYSTGLVVFALISITDLVSH